MSFHLVDLACDISFIHSFFLSFIYSYSVSAAISVAMPSAAGLTLVDVDLGSGIDLGQAPAPGTSSGHHGNYHHNSKYYTFHKIKASCTCAKDFFCSSDEARLGALP